MPIGTFIDHGATVEDSADPAYTAYLEARKKGKNLQAKPGDTIPVAGLKVTVVASAGETIKTALPGAGQPNPLCAEYKPQPLDSSENARSIGVVIAYGAFRMLDLGDLTWNIEHGLACPANLIGPVDLYLTTHHGNQQSGPPALVHAVRPRVAIQNNGADKGGAPSAWHIVRDSPGLQDLWQLHTVERRRARREHCRQVHRQSGRDDCAHDQGFGAAGWQLHGHQHQEQPDEDVPSGRCALSRGQISVDGV